MARQLGRLLLYAYGIPDLFFGLLARSETRQATCLPDLPCSGRYQLCFRPILDWIFLEIYSGFLHRMHVWHGGWIHEHNIVFRCRHFLFRVQT